MDTMPKGDRRNGGIPYMVYLESSLRAILEQPEDLQLDPILCMVCACVCACPCVFVCVWCVCACMCVSVYVCVYVLCVCVYCIYILG